LFVVVLGCDKRRGTGNKDTLELTDSRGQQQDAGDDGSRGKKETRLEKRQRCG
jgi:hypothetical protein